ncbi:hypothetical protein ILYODFUR_021998 [Ilyodon furcidens]|uniref:Uncharacterized protein n=1 Tax=Ilyodon furcidens TaxID=33524 RepID=A0ABV0SZF4_9TELE
MEALDLPGCFRTRSHSYLRAIQAGYSQDDDCIPPMASTVTSTIRSTTDRNYVQEETCLPDQDSIPEDLADAAPLAHDDLGCPIRRDRLYNQGATAKPMSGPRVSPSLFRSPRSSAPERPSPKAIQASIKESATLAAAISMQWKEEVSAMRRELAELRRDLCKELRAFNSNFNTFTQHYNTWSPQGGRMATGAGTALGKGVVTGSGTGTRVGTGIGGGGVATTSTNKGTGGAREKNPQISKVSVGIQARSKALVRQSTADAAVNCPEEKEEKKSSRRNLPKQLSMDPSILACPQSMYVESAIPLSLDPILPCSSRAVKLDPIDSSVSSRSKPDLELLVKDTVTLSASLTNEAEITQEAVLPSSEKVLESSQDSTVKQEMLSTHQHIDVGQTNESHSHSKQSHTDDKKSQVSEQVVKDKIKLPYPVPTVTVSPPEEQDYDITPHQESVDPVNVEKPQAIPEDYSTESFHLSGAEESDPSDSTEIDPKTSKITLLSTSDPLHKDSASICNIQSLDSHNVQPNYSETGIQCPSIVVSEHFDTDSPASPTDSDTNLYPCVTSTDYPSETPPEQVKPGPDFAFSSTESQPNTEPEFQESEWPPLPEPLDNTPIYHADLVHFDIVMLTSLDQDDLDSVFMDPEPEPFNLSADSSFNVDDVEPPSYQFDSQSSPLPNVDAYDDVSESPEVLFPKVTVTISPPSSVSPDTSLEIDFGPTSPTPDHALPDTEPSSPDFQEFTPSDDVITETLECVAVSQGIVGHVEEETPDSSERSSFEHGFLWYRWQNRGKRRVSVRRSASVELWSGRYEYNSSEITYVSLTL